MKGMRFYGYGLLNKDGDKVSTLICRDKKEAEEYVEDWDREVHLSAPFRAIELFYKEEQS